MGVACGLTEVFQFFGITLQPGRSGLNTQNTQRKVQFVSKSFSGSDQPVTVPLTGNTHENRFTAFQICISLQKYINNHYDYII